MLCISRGTAVIERPLRLSYHSSNIGLDSTVGQIRGQQQNSFSSSARSCPLLRGNTARNNRKGDLLLIYSRCLRQPQTKSKAILRISTTVLSLAIIQTWSVLSLVSITLCDRHSCKNIREVSNIKCVGNDTLLA
jgi:hypothetical protein